MSGGKLKGDGHDDSQPAMAGQQSILLGGEAGAQGAQGTYTLDPSTAAAAAAVAAAYRQQPSQADTAQAAGQQPRPHYLPMEPPVGQQQPLLNYGVSYVPSQAGGGGGTGDQNAVYEYFNQMPMQHALPPAQAAVGTAAGTAQSRSKPAKRKQVKNACVNCQKACKKCDDERPCQRCKKYNIADTCANSPRKERKKGVKRGPYKRRQKLESGAAGSQLSGEGPSEEGTLASSMMGNVPGISVVAPNVPSHELPYYGGYYPTQQPVIYADPSQFPHAQPGGYYYMQAPPPQAHQVQQLPPIAGTGVEHVGASPVQAPQQLQQQAPQQGQQPQAQQTAAHPAYYYQQYYAGPPPGAPAGQPPGGFPVGMAAAHAAQAHPGVIGQQQQQQQQAGQAGAAAAQSIQSQPTDGQTAGFPGGIQHTAAMMLAPVLPRLPPLPGQRRDSKINILSELCSAVLDCDGKHIEGADQSAMQKQPCLETSATDKRASRGIPSPSPEDRAIRRANSTIADHVSDRFLLRRRSSCDSDVSDMSPSSAPMPTYAVISPPSSPQLMTRSGRQLRVQLPPIGLGALGIITPDRSPTEGCFPADEQHREQQHLPGLDSIHRLLDADKAKCPWRSTPDANPLPYSWPSYLPALDNPERMLRSSHVVEALIPARRFSLPVLSMTDTSALRQTRLQRRASWCVTTGDSTWDDSTSQSPAPLSSPRQARTITRCGSLPPAQRAASPSTRCARRAATP